jgi:DNA-binding HxlR family transcriptional regulator
MKVSKVGPDSACPVARALNVLGDRWSLLIVRDAFDGVTRFGDFVDSLGIARNILTSRLLALGEAGVMTTLPASDGSPYQDYVLTEAGLRLFPLMLALRQWGEDQLYRPGEPHSRLVERAGGRLVPRQQVLGTEGQALRPEQTIVRKLRTEGHADGRGASVRRPRHERQQRE